MYLNIIPRNIMRHALFLLTIFFGTVSAFSEKWNQVIYNTSRTTYMVYITYFEVSDQIEKNGENYKVKARLRFEKRQTGPLPYGYCEYDEGYPVYEFEFNKNLTEKKLLCTTYYDTTSDEVKRRIVEESKGYAWLDWEPIDYTSNEWGAVNRELRRMINDKVNSSTFSKNTISDNPSGSSNLRMSCFQGDEQEVWMAKVKIEGNPALIDLAGNYITEPGKYQYIDDFEEGLCCVRRDGKYGYINIYGKEVIPCTWEYACSFHNGFAEVTDIPLDLQEGSPITVKKGLINKKGERVIYPPKYYYIVVDGNLMRTEGPTELLDSKGNVLFSNLFSIYDSHEGWIEFNADGNYKKYLYNPETKVKLGPYRDILGGFNHGYCAVKLRDHNKGEVSGYINTDGDKFIIDKYDITYKFDKNGYANVIKDEKFGLINTNFEEIIPCKYKYIGSLDESGLFLVFRENSEGQKECAITNLNNELLSPFGKYKKIEEIGKSKFYRGYLICTDDTKAMQVLLTKNFERANPYEYTELYGNFDQGFIHGKRDGKNVLINNEGREIAITDYGIEWKDINRSEVLRIYSDTGQGGKKYGLMTPEGKIIVPPTYDHIGYFYDGEARVIQDKKHGFINKEGKIVRPFVNQYIYDECNNYECDRRGMCKVVGNAWKYGYKNKAGVEVIPCVFDKISTFKKVSVK